MAAGWYILIEVEGRASDGSEGVTIFTWWIPVPQVDVLLRAGADGRPGLRVRSAHRGMGPAGSF